jgi:bla regulator protein blaR1
MHLALIDIFLSDGTARAVSWTLVHSLWEGLLAAVLAGLIIGCTRKLPPTLRYNLLAADLLLFLLVAGATFFYELRQEDHPVPAGAVQLADARPGSAARNAATTILTGSTGNTALGTGTRVQQPGTDQTAIAYWQRIADYLNTHAAIVTLAWLTCFSVQLLRLMGGVYQARRLRRNIVAPPGDRWNEKLSELARRLGIKRTVTLVQSRLIKAPATVGFLKPYILLPFGILANLPPDQVETILLHELAHIRRGDYISNLLLHLTEAIFFFNPGVRWIATVIRREREACCDDMVLAGTPDKNSYFEALMAFTQFAIDGRVTGSRIIDGRVAVQPFTLQLGGGKKDLLWRVRRMLENENRKLQIMEKAILSFGLMILVSVSLISMKRKDGPLANPNMPARTIVATPAESAAFALPAGPAAISTVPTRYPMVDTPPRQQQQDSNGNLILKTENLTFTSVTSHSYEHQGQKKYHAKAIDDSGNRYEIRKLDDAVTEFRVNGSLVEKEDYARYANVFAGFEAQQRQHPPQPAPAQAAPAMQAAPTAQTPPVSAIGTPQQAQTPQQARTPAYPSTPPQAETPDNPGNPEPAPTPEVAPTPANPLVYTRHPDPYLQKIAADLVAMQLITHVDTFSFTLNADELIVNGTRQPENIYTIFKTKYVKHATDHFIYSQYYTKHSSGSHAEVNTSGSDRKAPGDARIISI